MKRKLKSSAKKSGFHQRTLEQAKRLKIKSKEVLVKRGSEVREPYEGGKAVRFKYTDIPREIFPASLGNKGPAPKSTIFWKMWDLGGGQGGWENKSQQQRREKGEKEKRAKKGKGGLLNGNLLTRL